MSKKSCTFAVAKQRQMRIIQINKLYHMADATLRLLQNSSESQDSIREKLTITFDQSESVLGFLSDKNYIGCISGSYHITQLGKAELMKGGVSRQHRWHRFVEICSITAALMSILSFVYLICACSTQVSVAKSHIDYIEFGTAGGFNGSTLSKYTLNCKGEVYNNGQLFCNIPAEQLNLIFESADSVNCEQKEFGNTYHYIKIKRNKKIDSFYWRSNQGLDNKLLFLSNQLNSIIHEKTMSR